MTITGIVERFRYRNDENGFAIILLRLADGETAVVKGPLAAMNLGMKVECNVEEEVDPKYGRQYRAASWMEMRPSDIEGIKKYLASGMIKYIGPVFAEKIVAQFGEESLDVLDNHPERLAEISGIGKKRIENVIKSAQEQRDRRSIMIWLKRYDLPNGLASKILDNYGSSAIQTLEKNPYRLINDVDGVGFKKADFVAGSIGISPESSFRIRSGLMFALREFTENGSTYMPVDMLIRKASSEDILNLPAETVASEWFTWIGEDGYKPFREENGCAYPASLYNAEVGVARRLQEMLDSNDGLFRKDNRVDVNLNYVVSKTGVRYNAEQVSAILTACQKDIFVLTGGPGTGKTVTTNGIIVALEKEDKKVMLLAPTGRAAKRMMEVTGRKAQTIHRGLEYGHEGFARCADNPLDADAVIVDECSMIDIQLMRSLLDAISNRTRLILVGDVDQLPSVGSGRVLHDIISSGKVPTVRLTEIYRQAQNSQIVMAAHAINKGHRPYLSKERGLDLRFVKREDREEIVSYIVNLVTNHIPNVFKYPVNDIQVLSPMRRSGDPIGITYLNQELQKLLNKNTEGIQFGDIFYKVGDKVMQIKNNYSKDVFNGDIGIIRSVIEREDGKTDIEIEFNGNILQYEKKELAEIELAYATTVHKSQGSEYPVVIMPVHKSHFVLLKRNLLYTAVTRAKKLCILVGTEDAVEMAVRNEDTTKRFTGLRQRICGETLSEEVTYSATQEKSEDEKSDKKQQEENNHGNEYTL